MPQDPPADNHGLTSRSPEFLDVRVARGPRSLALRRRVVRRAEATWIVGMVGGSVAAGGIRTETGRIRSIIAGRHSSAVR